MTKILFAIHASLQIILCKMKAKTYDIKHVKHRIFKETLKEKQDAKYSTRNNKPAVFATVLSEMQFCCMVQ